MIEENEFLVLVLSIGIFIFILLNFKKLKSLPNYLIFTLSYLSLLLGWTFTVLESLFFELILNFIEHICYLLFVLLLILWLILSYRLKMEEKE
jgi:hypothetical protein